MKIRLIMVVSIISFIHAQSFDYIGTGKCKTCHKSEKKGAQYKKWEGSPHANSFETLKSEESIKIASDLGLENSPWEAPVCLKCHTTGYGSGGYELEDDAFWAQTKKNGKPEKAVKRMTGLQGVGCEACHGPGEGYIKAKKNYKGKGKDAFKKILKDDPMAARKAQYDAGLLVAGINKYKTIKEQCLNCHWEDAGAKNKCPKCEGTKNSKGQPRLFTKGYIKRDDHRDHDGIDDVKKDAKKWKGYVELDPWYKTKPPNAK